MEIKHYEFVYGEYGETTGIRINLNGFDVLRFPNINKGLAFTIAEKRQLKLSGFLPPRVRTLEEQVEQVLKSLTKKKMILKDLFISGAFMTGMLSLSMLSLQAMSQNFYPLSIHPLWDLPVSSTLNHSDRQTEFIFTRAISIMQNIFYETIPIRISR